MADNDFVVKNGLVVNTNVLVVNGTSNKVGINTATPDADFTVAGTANVSGNVAVASNLTVGGNTSITGRFEVVNNAYIDKKLYVGNTETMIQDLPTIIQAVDNFNGFVMISSQNLSKLDDACADLITYADNTNGLTHFNDIGINNSRFDGTIHRISANTLSDGFQLGETLYQRNNTGANIAVGVLRDRTVINSTSRSLKISILETDGIKTTLGAPQYTNTAGANLSLRGVTSGVNSNILVAVGFFESDGANGAYSRRNYPFTIGRRGDGYLYNANSALAIGTTGGGMRTDIQTINVSFVTGANQITLSSGNTSLIYADMIVAGTGIPVGTYITSVVNSTAFNMSAATTAGSSGSYTATDPYYDASGNPIIFHVGGMTANDEIARFVGNGNFVIGPNTTSRDSKITVAGTANITGNAVFGGTVSVAGNSSVTGKLTVSGTANVIGNTGFNGDLSVAGNSSVTGKLTVSGTANVIGNTGFNGTVSVAGNTTVTGKLTVSGTANVIGNTGFNGDLSVAGNSAVTGKLTVSGTANVIGNTGFNGDLSVAGNTVVVGNIKGATSNITGNSVVGGDINVTGNTVITGNLKGAGVSELKIAGNANISGNLAVGGNFTVTGAFTTTSSVIAGGDYYPLSNGYNLGNTTSRWDLFAIDVFASNTISTVNLNSSNAVTVGANVVSNTTSVKVGNTIAYAYLDSTKIETTGNLIGVALHAPTVNTVSVNTQSVNASATLIVGATTNSVSVNTTAVLIGNSLTFATVNSTVFSGTANNSTNFNGQAASFYVNATNISTGTLAAARLPTGNATTIGGLQIVDSLSNTSITIPATANNVKTAYDSAINANTRAASAQTAAVSAYSNAVTYADTKAATAYSNAVSYADTKAATAFSNAVANAAAYTDTKAATAYSNAVANAAAYTDTKAATAYSNAVSYTDTKAATAFSNAVANAAAYTDTKAATAYSNAVANAAAYTDTKAATAFSNAVANSAAYTDTKSATAYSNAVANAAAYTDTKSSAAYSNAVTYIDTKSSAAYTNAVSYADTKAATAYSNSVTYADTYKVAKSGDSLTGGFTSTSADDGTKSSGTYTPTPIGGNMRHIINGGAFTFAAPTAAGSYSLVVEITNGTSPAAGAVTFTGFAKTTGDVLTTTAGHKFQLAILKTNSGVTLNIGAMQ